MEYTPVIKATTQKNYNVCKKGPIPDTPSSKYDKKVPLKKITPPPAPHH
jgi:hypothetical protein